MAFSLRRRVLLTVSPLVVLLAGVGAAGAYLLADLGRQSDAILKENYDSIAAMHALTRAVAKIEAAKTPDERTAAWAEADAAVAVEKANITIRPDEPQLVAELEERLETFRRNPASGGPVRETAEAVAALNEKAMRAASARAEATGTRSLFGFGVGLALAVLAAGLAVWGLLHALLGPVRAVTNAASAIGRGELHLVVPVAANDELGTLAAAFNDMAAKLRAYRQTDTDRLRRARETGRATIDSFPDPVVVVDPLGRVESANPAARRLLGVLAPADHETPKAWQPPDVLAEALAVAVRDRRPVVTESFADAVTFRLDGEERFYLPQVRPIDGPGGEPLGAAVVLADVTRFRLLDRLKSDWVATVSHELKTPLTGLRLAVHVLLEEVVGPLEPKQIELLLEARDNAERLLNLIEHLLALAKLEEGRDVFTPRPTDAAELLRAAVDRAATRAADARITLNVEAETVPQVNADPDRIGRALDNLVDNALVHTDAGGTVTLTAAVAGPNRVRLTVADTGVGIPPEHLPHVFERFFRVPGRDRGPGTGLGLAIVRETAVAHGGEAAVTSEPGRGTAVHLTLPTAEAAP